jgi:hypothetical protein
MTLCKEETEIFKAIIAAREVQTFLWGEQNQKWGLEEWRRMFKKRLAKIDDIDINKPYAIIELRKRLLQNAALSIALLNILNHSEIDRGIGLPHSNLDQYADR